MRRALLPGSLVVLLACSTLVPTEVIVHIDADSISRARARHLHVNAVSHDGLETLDLSPSLVGDSPRVKLPTSIPFTPQDDRALPFTIFAELRDQADVAFNKTRATLSFTKGKLVEFELDFSDLCIEVECPDSQRCDRGTCVDITTPPHGENGPLSTDAQPAICQGALCWEEPRPGGQGAKAACLWAPDAGLVVDNGWALELKGGVWIAEPLPPGVYPESVACWSGGEALATSGTSILERSASGWKALDLGGTALHGIWGLTANDVWAVADGGVIWRRKNHGSWTKVTSGVSANLRGIFGLMSSDIYVVGSQSTLLHYDGNAFTAVPGPAAADPGFTHVAATSQSDLHIKAGASVWSFDGKAWSKYAPFLGVVSLTGGPSGLMVAGGSRGAAYFRSKIGTPWGISAIGFPFAGPSLPAVAVSGQSAIVGGDAGGLSHWSGTAWDSSAAWLTRGYLYSIANDPDESWHAVAVSGGTVLERVEEGVWRRRVVGEGPVVKSPDLRAVWMGHGIFIAVGVAGVIAESTTGHDWSVVPSGTTQDLAAIDSTGGKVIAAGSAGTLLERTASGWIPFATPIPTSPGLTVLRGAADGSLFAGAADGSVWKLAVGGGWTKLGALPVPVSDLGIDISGGVWACGNGIYHLQAGAFAQVAVSISGPPHLLLMDGASPGWIGSDGAVYRRQADGTYAGVGPPATAMSLAADGRFFMVGNYGWILSGHAP